MLSIRLKPALERRLSRLARQTGRTKTFYATELIEENIEDLEDRYLAEARLENRASATPPLRSGGSLAWTIEYDEGAAKDLKKLNHQVQREILDFMEKRIGQAKDPRSFGKPLRHSKFGLWRYGLRDYRIICKLSNEHGDARDNKPLNGPRAQKPLNRNSA
ncbi:MAG TPA: type II toxin-antitoxin system RelE/ParE family toxin [Candidatus Polarisedimenticolia bacterium]|nr:type II toxin-antitoxin system RelE/ParE family toxin [Candidatus Polarisedimenticolia bacterium]